MWPNPSSSNTKLKSKGWSVSVHEINISDTGRTAIERTCVTEHIREISFTNCREKAISSETICQLRNVQQLIRFIRRGYHSRVISLSSRSRRDREKNIGQHQNQTIRRYHGGGRVETEKWDGLMSANFQKLKQSSQSIKRPGTAMKTPETTQCNFSNLPALTNPACPVRIKKCHTISAKKFLTKSPVPKSLHPNWTRKYR